MGGMLANTHLIVIHHLWQEQRKNVKEGINELVGEWNLLHHHQEDNVGNRQGIRKPIKYYSLQHILGNVIERGGKWTPSIGFLFSWYLEWDETKNKKMRYWNHSKKVGKQKSSGRNIYKYILMNINRKSSPLLSSCTKATRGWSFIVNILSKDFPLPHLFLCIFFKYFFLSTVPVKNNSFSHLLVHDKRVSGMAP